MQAIEILKSKHGYDLDFSTPLDFDYKLEISNIATFTCDEMKALFDAGFLCNVYSNIGHTEDGFGFKVVIFDK